MNFVRVLALGWSVGVSTAVLAAPTVERFPIFITGIKAGEQIVTREPDGLVKVSLEYKNNGRGPDYEEQFRLAPDGTFSEYQISGTSTYGSRVDEQFSVSDGKASWKSPAESETRAVIPGAMYVPVNSTFEASSVAIAALLASPTASLPLYPAGTLVQRKLDETDVVAADSRRQRVQLLTQTGLGLEPTFIWATTATKPRFFAHVDSAFMVVADGWQNNEKLLGERQRIAETTLLKELASRLQQPLKGLTVVRNTRVFDSEAATLGKPSDV